MHTAERTIFMKKVLSILLAFAMIISCISIVSFAENTAKGVEISGNGTADYMRTTGIGADVQKAVDAVVGGNGRGYITVYAHNTGDKNVELNVFMQNGWDYVSNTSSVSITMAPNESARFVIWFNVKNGKLMNGAAEQDMNNLTLRTDVIDFNSAQGAKFVIWSPDISTDLFKKMNSNGRTVTEVEAPTTLNIPDKKVVNGDAENGNTGWANFAAAGGSVEQVEGGANGTAHAMKFVPGNANKYASIGFNLGAAIINDKDNNYVGGGAGKYKVTFYAKANTGKGGNFQFVLNSQYHSDATALKRDLTEAQYEALGDLAGNTYIYVSPGFKMTDEWQKFEIEFEVSEKFLALVQKLYGMGFTNAYDLILRLDGAGGAYATERFDYYVDEVTIEKLPDATPGEDGGDDAPATPTPEVKVAKGIQVTYNEETKGDHYIISKTGVLSASEIKNGKITRKFLVKNNGEEDVQVTVRFEVTHTKADNSQTWTGPKYNEMVTVPAGKQVEIEYTMDVNADGTVTIDNGGKKTDYDISKFFIRFSLTDGNLPAGTSVTFYCDDATAKAFTENVKMAFMDKATLVLTYADPANGGDLLPVAFIAMAVVATVALVVVSRKRKEF